MQSLIYIQIVTYPDRIICRMKMDVLMTVCRSDAKQKL